MPPISVMIKPASGLCNMQCRYCFYHSVATARESYSFGMMEEDLLKEIIGKAFAFTKGQTVNLSFQGGEPLLRGKEFFKKLPRYIQEQNTFGSDVHVAIQTNGTLLDDEWCELFHRHHYLVGLSLDGDRCTNAYRVFKDGSEAFDTVSKKISLLQQHKVDFNILAVLTDKVANRIEEIYRFYTSQNIKHLQFIPCLKPLNETSDDPMYLNGIQYGAFLIKLFKLYYRDFLKGDYVSIRLFDNMVRLAAGKEPEQCGMNGHCSYQFILEANGNVYPCDYFCLDEYLLGNIQEKDFSALSQSEPARQFIKESFSIDPKCKKCNYYQLCRGGCKRERHDIEFCEAYQLFYKECLPYIVRMKKVCFG